MSKQGKMSKSFCGPVSIVFAPSHTEWIKPSSTKYPSSSEFHVYPFNLFNLGIFFYSIFLIFIWFLNRGKTWKHFKLLNATSLNVRAYSQGSINAATEIPGVWRHPCIASKVTKGLHDDWSYSCWWYSSLQWVGSWMQKQGIFTPTPQRAALTITIAETTCVQSYSIHRSWSGLQPQTCALSDLVLPFSTSCCLTRRPTH